MKKIITEQTQFIEAYKCSNNHVFPKYKPATGPGFRGMGTLPVRNTLAFYKCCPECGSMGISVVTGCWEAEFEVTGRIFKKKTLIAKRFIETAFGGDMDKHTLTLNEYIKAKLRKGDTEFDVGIRYACGEVYIDDQSLSRISFKIVETGFKPVST